MFPSRFLGRVLSPGLFRIWRLAGFISLMTSLGVQGASTTSRQQFETDLRPLVKQYCLDCHSTERQKGELDLEQFRTLADVVHNPEPWEWVVDQLTLGEMPPKDEPQPSDEERNRLMSGVNAVLHEAAMARAGDPGPVVLRRLNNAEYTYTVRDLTGVDSLDPAREFPTDSASGEGFMNVGNSLVMSPSLVTKYLDAAKEIAGHAVLSPDGIRFSPHTSRRDWTEELLEEIRGVYGQYTDQGGGTSVNLQGIRFDTNDGGVLPLDRYLEHLLQERENGSKRNAVAHGLSPKYLDLLRETLNGTNRNILLQPIRAQWRQAGPGDGAKLARTISQWQHALWKFNSVGHIGKEGGPKAWMEPLTPVQSEEYLRQTIPADSNDEVVTFHLAASDAGDGNDGDFVLWEQPRLVSPGKPDLMLRDLQSIHRRLSARRDEILRATDDYLKAAWEADAGETNLTELAGRHSVDPDALQSWLNFLGIDYSEPADLEGHFTTTFTNANGYAFINGWGDGGTPHLVANASDQHVRIPGNMKPHSVAVHPSPDRNAAAGWRSPVDGRFRIEAAIQHAHPECGNGVAWMLEVRRGSSRRILSEGIAHGSTTVQADPIDNLAIRAGDVVSLSIGARGGNHSCDLTAIDLRMIQQTGNENTWDLAADVSPDVLAGNPHADRLGNHDVWHFFTEPAELPDAGPAIPSGSLLAEWQSTESRPAKIALAVKIRELAMMDDPVDISAADKELHRQLTSLSGPLFKGMATHRTGGEEMEASQYESPTSGSDISFGLEAERFGRHPDGSLIDAYSICVQAPSVLELRLPGELVAGYELVVTGRLDARMGAEGSIQLTLSTNRPATRSGLQTIATSTSDGTGPWYSNNRVTAHESAIVANEGSDTRRRIEADLEEFRRIFPAALCYTKIVPVDEVVTLTLYYREDHHFKRLMLNGEESRRLDRLWNELRYVSQEPLKMVDVFEQLWQYATQDADPSVFEPMREPIQREAEAFRQQLLETQPAHLDAVIAFAGKAYRRPLSNAEQAELRNLYRGLRAEEIGHEDAIRLTLARVLVAPSFLYRLEQPVPGTEPGPVNDWELATRLSYFLWSSTPDDVLLSIAGNKTLQDPEVLAKQSRRMLDDPRVRRLAVEFACAWLHIHGFNELDEKSERHFPSFGYLRDDMYEETIRFFTGLFQNDGSVLDILDADHTYLNEALAKHYGIAGSAVEAHSDSQWVRVEDVRSHGRGGVLAQAAVLSKQSGASRTSPILRGNWVAEVLLGEKLPRPPADVPQLPEDEAEVNLTVRELTERHTTDPKCYGCHKRIDPYGFSLEAYDAIGRYRDRDMGGRPIDTQTQVLDGTELNGLEGLRNYLVNARRNDFLKQFCRKLLGYSLGRSVLLSDGPLIDEMIRNLEANDYRFSIAVETIVRSRQFREIRGKEHEQFGSR